MKPAKYTTVVDETIVSRVDSGDYHNKSAAFRAVAAKFGLRPDQVMGRYYAIKSGKNILTYDEFDPGTGKFDRKGGDKYDIPEVQSKKEPELFESEDQDEATIFDVTDGQDIAIEFRRNIVMSLVDQMKKPELMNIIQELIKKVI